MKARLIKNNSKICVLNDFIYNTDTLTLCGEDLILDELSEHDTVIESNLKDVTCPECLKLIQEIRKLT